MPMTTYRAFEPAQTTNPEIREVLDDINDIFEKNGTKRRVYVEEFPRQEGILWWKRTIVLYHVLVSIPMKDGELYGEYQCIDLGCNTKECVISYLYGFFLCK